MMSIKCPWCGARNQDEFACGGEAHILRPARPETVSDKSWADYQYSHAAAFGLHLEKWHHLYGCGQWFNVARDTRTHQIKSVYRVDEDPPEGLS